jgi:hypothetical protein
MKQFDQLFARRDDAVTRRYEYDDRIVMAADVGSVDAAVDVVGDTAIVVAGENQFEIDLPGDEARASINNGVLSIEVEQ